MDQSSQEELKRILQLPIHDLAVADKEFLHARRVYLTRSQLEDYSEVIDEIHTRNTSQAENTGNVDAPEKPKVQSQPQNQQGKKKDKTNYQSKDVRLNLDQKSEKQLTAQKALAEAKRLQEEADAELKNDDQANGNIAAQNEGSADAECLDPDCTHDSMNCPVYKAEHAQ